MDNKEQRKVKFQVTIWENAAPELYQRLAVMSERQRAEEARYLMRVGMDIISGAKMDNRNAQAVCHEPSKPAPAKSTTGMDWGIGGSLIDL